ncbi:MAG: hypothetical protein ACM34O_04235 [Ignavibacteria bacterium]
MKKVLIISLFIVTACPEFFGQYVFLKGNVNFFNMGKMKDFQDQLMAPFKEINVPIEAVESFPARPGWQIGFLYTPPGDSNVALGAFFDYASTGGRIHYQDYSGEVKVDQIVNAYSCGGILNIRYKQWEFTRLDFVLSARVIFSSLKNKLFFQIGDQSDSQELDFKSTSIGIEPGANYSVFMNLFNINFGVSYLFNIPADLVYSENDEAYLTDQAGNKISLDWGGVKFGISFGYGIN